jgi:L-threonylcarbamoyladenylate synthase
MPKKTASQKIAAGEIISGKIAIFPTDTVLGIGASPFAPGAIERITRVKQRTNDKPYALLVASEEQIRRLFAGQALPEAAQLLAKRFWPGSLTMIVDFPDNLAALSKSFANQSDALFREEELIKAAPAWSKWIAPQGEIGIRVPEPSWLRSFIAACGGLIAATSANLSGKANPPDLAKIDPSLLSGIDLIYAPKGVVMRSHGVASTVVRITAQRVELIREGVISADKIQQALKRC